MKFIIPIIIIIISFIGVIMLSLGVGKIHDNNGKCFDKNNNEINGVTCQVDKYENGYYSILDISPLTLLIGVIMFISEMFL